MSDAPRRPDGMIELDRPVELPKILDMLIVGGGPVGTAAAFRAKEIGLAALVIDYDDLMARIRDYAKDKLIYPSYGGGDNMRFPKGDGLVEQLHFGPLDKDDMFRHWKSLYRTNSIPAQVGVELTGLSAAADGVWTASCWNHNVDAEQSIAARHVVLGFGRGVPRRLDIPGNVEGLAFRMADAAGYVGEPVCVIGGGTSAAEAVIAISNAKVAAGDTTPVCWSYRGDKMPKVSKALAEVFFDAYLGNGNIRYLPKSNPVAVASELGTDKLLIQEHALGADGRLVESRPLEFEKKFTIACIGSDVPDKVLAGFGIDMVTGGKANKRRMCVSPLLESVVPNVFLAGDLLSPVYLETDDFDADPATFTEVRRRGNIKAALRDGIFVAEVVAQKLQGKTDIRVEVEFVDDEPDETDPTAKATPAPVAGPVRGGSPVDSHSATEPGLVLVRVLPTGIEADEFPIVRNGVTTIGRRGCDVSFEQDTSLADRHASISHGRDGCYVKDESGAGGLYLQLAAKKTVRLEHGAILRVGQQWLVGGPADDPGRLIHFDNSGREVARYQVDEETVLIGRKSPDINLDADDKTLSRRHLSARRDDGRLLVRDLESTGGTYVRTEGLTKIEVGDRILLGQQRIALAEPLAAAPRNEVHLDSSQTGALQANRAARAEMSGGYGRAGATAARGESEPTSGASEVAEPAPEAASGNVVTFVGSGRKCLIKPGQTICEVAEDNDIEIIAECHTGVCGSDPIRVESGGEHCNDMGEEERDALEDICGLDPTTHRLACMTRAKGPVTVAIVEE